MFLIWFRQAQQPMCLVLCAHSALPSAVCFLLLSLLCLAFLGLRLRSFVSLLSFLLGFLASLGSLSLDLLLCRLLFSAARLLPGDLLVLRLQTAIAWAQTVWTASQQPDRQYGLCRHFPGWGMFTI